MWQECTESSLEQGLSVLNLASERAVNFGLQGVTSHDEEWESEISDGEGLLSGI